MTYSTTKFHYLLQSLEPDIQFFTPLARNETVFAHEHRVTAHDSLKVGKHGSNAVAQDCQQNQRSIYNSQNKLLTFKSRVLSSATPTACSKCPKPSILLTHLQTVAFSSTIVPEPISQHLSRHPYLGADARQCVNSCADWYVAVKAEAGDTRVRKTGV